MSLTDRLQNFFSPNRWQDSTDRFTHSGMALVQQVNDLKPKVVVDVGCGYNLFKGKIPNLIGIDLVNEAADIVCDLKDAPIRDESIDVALALGSINFGDQENILSSLQIVHRWLVPGGTLFMRANPGEPIGDDIEVFPWSEEMVDVFAHKVGFSPNYKVVEEELITAAGVPARRLFWTYTKF